MKRFVIGDIHGRFKALQEVLKKSNFNHDKDLLIILGDVVDGGYFTSLVVEELLKIKNKIYIVGNHDEWWMNHIRTGWAEEIWLQQGGANTLRSYGGQVKTAEYLSDNSIVSTENLRIPDTHRDFFNSGVYYYVLDDMVFVHGGFNPLIALNVNQKHDLVWDRNLINTARKKPIYRNDKYPVYKSITWKKVFVGHTTTQSYKSILPLKFNNLWMLDTGAGWDGRLTIMDIDTEKYWQSKKQKPSR